MNQAAKHLEDFKNEIERVKAIIAKEVEQEFPDHIQERLQYLESEGHCPNCHYYLVDKKLRQAGIKLCHTCWQYLLWYIRVHSPKQVKTFEEVVAWNSIMPDELKRWIVDQATRTGLE